MPVNVIWDDDHKTIIRQIYSGHIVQQDYVHATNEVERLAKSVPYTVHSIMDRTRVTSLPSLIVPAMRYANTHVPSNLGMRVIIKGDIFTHIAAQIGRRVAPRIVHNLYFVDTLEAARALIARHIGEGKG